MTIPTQWHGGTSSDGEAPPAPLLGGAAGLPPPWITGDIEWPLGSKTIDGATYSVFTAEQQSRLGCNEDGGNKDGNTDAYCLNEDGKPVASVVLVGGVST